MEPAARLRWRPVHAIDPATGPAGGMTWRTIVWWKPPRQPAFCLFRPRMPFFPLASFQRGIDNIRIDVSLSPLFTQLARSLAASLLSQQAASVRKQIRVAGAVRHDLEAFRESYASMLEAAIHRARVEEQHNLLALMQLAVIKFVTELVILELGQFIHELKVSLSGTRPEQVEKSTQLYDRVVWLTKNQARIRYTVTRMMLQQLYKVEKGGLGELQAALLGGRRVVPASVFTNPLLQAGAPISDEILLKHYVLIGNRVDDRNSLAALRGLMRRAFADLHTTDCQPCPVTYVGADGLEPIPPVELVAEDVEVPGWWEAPENMDILLNRERYQEYATQLRQRGRAGEHGVLPQVEAHMRFQRAQLDNIEVLLRETGLKYDVLANHELRTLYNDFSEWVNPQLLYQYLVGGRQARNVLQKIRVLVREGEPGLLMRRLEDAARRVRRQARRKSPVRVLHYLKELAAYQRDLHQYDVVQEAMKGINLLEEPNDLRLSRGNNRLYEFTTLDEEPGARHVIRTHTVLKADVRGSTRVTAELLRHGLNPASHFDSNFFAPIRELLDPFGAAKVFIEGDAVILAIFESEGDAGNWLSVARACGLAQSMLQVVAIHNRKNRAHRLPLLEFGIGIAYAPEPPAFLYDGEQPIMISPAIGRADRLSSCAWGLRAHYPGGGVPRNPVAVFEIDEQALSEPQFGGKGERYARYNINGIALDEAAFEKLRSEIDLKRVSLDVYGSGKPAVFYLGRYPQTTGVLRRLAVREGRIRSLREPERETGRFYYEVVTNPKLLELLDSFFY